MSKHVCVSGRGTRGRTGVAGRPKGGQRPRATAATRAGPTGASRGSQGPGATYPAYYWGPRVPSERRRTTRNLNTPDSERVEQGKTVALFPEGAEQTWTQRKPRKSLRDFEH